MAIAAVEVQVLSSAPDLDISARVAELVDALASGASEHLFVEVQVLSRAPLQHNLLCCNGESIYKVSHIF